MPNFTLCIDEDTTRRIREHLRVFGGSVGGFATGITKDLARLETQKIVLVRQQINALVREQEAEQLSGKKAKPLI